MHKLVCGNGKHLIITNRPERNRQFYGIAGIGVTILKGLGNIDLQPIIAKNVCLRDFLKYRRTMICVINVKRDSRNYW